MIRLLVLVYFLLIPRTGVSTVAPKPQDVLKIGYINYPPLIYQKHGKVMGALSTYIQDIFPDYKIEYMKIPLSRVQDLLDKKQIHIFPMYFYSSERAKNVHFVSQPYHSLSPCLCSLKKNPIPSKIRLAKAFKNKRIIHLRGTLKNRDFLDFDSTKYLELPTMNYVNKSIRLLKLGRADFAYYADLKEIESFISSNKIKDIHCNNSSYPKDHLYFATTKGYYLNKTIEEQLKRITFEPYLKKFLSSVDR